LQISDSTKATGIYLISKRLFLFKREPWPIAVVFRRKLGGLRPIFFNYAPEARNNLQMEVKIFAE
jgi:hypothetical protein